MHIFKNSLELFIKLKEVLFIVGVVVLWLLNIWFSGRFAPIASDLQIVAAEIERQKIQIKRVETKCDTFNSDLILEIKELKQDIKHTDDKITEIYKLLFETR